MDDVVILGWGTGHGGGTGALSGGPVGVDLGDGTGVCLGGRAGVALRGGTGVTCGGFPLSVVVPGLPKGISSSLGVLALCPVFG